MIRDDRGLVASTVRDMKTLLLIAAPEQVIEIRFVDEPPDDRLAAFVAHYVTRSRSGLVFVDEIAQARLRLSSRERAWIGTRSFAFCLYPSLNKTVFAHDLKTWRGLVERITLFDRED